MRADPFKPIVRAAKRKIEVMTPYNDEIKVPLRQSICQFTVNDQYFRFSRQGYAIRFAVNAIEFLELLSGFLGNVFKPFGVIQPEMIGFNSIRFKAECVILKLVLGLDAWGKCHNEIKSDTTTR